MATEKLNLPSIEALPFSLDAHITAFVLLLYTDVDDSKPVYVVGNFSKWRIDEEYEMTRYAPGSYYLIFEDPSDLPRPFEYKYAKKSWHGVELDPYGNPRPNRVVNRPLGFVQDFVPRWSQRIRFEKPLLPKIKLIEEDFEMPETFKTRRIAALLPHDYNETDKDYPVIYLQDGQNLFDDFAPFGNWGLDKRLASLAKEKMHDFIVISIDHAESDRITEYTPSEPTKLPEGDGKKYTEFLTEKLKPYVDTHFRTLPDRANTGIGGSSMGGLISIYAGILYPEIYSRFMIFSPSLWVQTDIGESFIESQKDLPFKLYLYAGVKESKTMVPNVYAFNKDITNTAFSSPKHELMLSIDEQGKHNEAYWGREFPKAVKWLLYDKEK